MFIIQAECTEESAALVIWLSNGRLYKLPVSEIPQADASKTVGCSLAENREYVVVEQESGNTFEVPWDQVLHLQEPSYAFYRDRDSVKGAETASASRIGSRLRELRTKAGISQVALARRAGLKTANLSRLESGKQVPSLETLERIAGALDRPVVDLIAERTIG